MANIDIWGPKSNNNSRKEALKPYAVNLSHRVYYLILDVSYIGKME